MAHVILKPAMPLHTRQQVSMSASARRALHVYEITAMVAAYLSRADMLSLALSYRGFYEPVMDRMWRVLPSLVPLLRCLPEELVGMALCPQNGRHVLCIKKAPELHQWERVRQHAQRVRIVASPRRDVSVASLCLIKLHYPEPLLLPNLRDCSLQGLAGSKEIDNLIQSSLHTLHYNIQPLLPNTWHLGRIARRAPDLGVLCLTDSGKTQRGSVSAFPDPDVGKALSDAILDFGNLTAVDFATCFHLDAIRHLSRLPRLARLHLYLDESNCIPLDAGPDGYFPFCSLKTLHIGGESVVRLSSWMQALQLPMLKTLRVSPSRSASLLSVEGLFDVIIRFDSLVSLKLFFSNTDLLASDSILKPLLRRLPYIEEFVLADLPFNPTRDSLAAIASAWPRLRNLELQISCYLKKTSRRVSLHDLLAIAYYCPAIERVAIPLSHHMVTNPTRREGDNALVIQTDPPFPASQNPLLAPILPNSTTSTGARIPASKLTELCIASDFVRQDYPRIAEFLAIVFPDAELTFRCPPRLKTSVEDCIQGIMRLKGEYLQRL